MPRDINDLRHERGELHTSMRAMLDVASSENRDLTGEEAQEYDRMEARFDEIGTQVGRMERIEARQRELAGTTALTPGRGPDGAVILDQEDGRPFNATKGYGNAFWAAARRGPTRIGGDMYAALEEGVNSEGGFLVPVEFDNQLVVALELFNEMRIWCTVIQTSSERRIPIESDDGVADWIDEEGVYPESDAAFSQVTLNAHKLAKIIKVSEELLRDAFFDLSSYIANNYGRTFGYAEEDAFINGDGTGKPTGIIPSADAGITAASATAITSDEVIDLYHALKRPYRGMATWMMADLTLKLIRKLKTTEGQYLWQPGLQANEPDLILGRPTIISDSVPAATTGLRSVGFGDLSYYTIADRSGREMQRLNELFAATGQIGFRMNSRTDGKLTLPEAVKVITMA